MLSGYLMYCLIEKYLIGTFKGMYKISTQVCRRSSRPFCVFTRFIFKHLEVPRASLFYFKKK